MKRTVYLLIFLLLSAPVWASDDASTVVMNTKTYIYHSPTCKWAKRCTKNCITPPKPKQNHKKPDLVKSAAVNIPIRIKKNDQESNPC